jgi:hypothetical protein
VFLVFVIVLGWPILATHREFWQGMGPFTGQAMQFPIAAWEFDAFSHNNGMEKLSKRSHVQLIFVGLFTAL